VIRLSALVQKQMERETALESFRGNLSEDDRAALDALCAELRESKGGAAMASSFSPFEGILLLMLVKQQRRMECLEFLFQRNAARILEDCNPEIRAKKCENR